MKGLLFINLLIFGFVLNGCNGEKSVAAAYKENGGKASSDSSTKDPEGDDPKDPPGDDPKDPPAGDGEGDADAGMVFLNDTCSSCHNTDDTALAKNVTLNAEAVSRLDAAYTGAQQGIHRAYSEAFEQPGRKDLEAAMNGITLRLQ